jgi:hypothetical protein
VSYSCALGMSESLPAARRAVKIVEPELDR